VFKRLYNAVLKWVEHPRAEKYLFALSFAESSFFPIPPDVMLAPMCLARPEKNIRFATVTTIASVLGGVFGYCIGYIAFDLIEPLIASIGYTHKFELVKVWFVEWGFWAVLIAGFSPVPYKVFTISAGLLGMLIIPFVLASLLGRGARFFLVAFLVSLGGDDLRANLGKHIEKIGWLVTLVIVVGLVVYKLN
jgi:membrane protein YqaA with SNARE-associated domain